MNTATVDQERLVAVLQTAIATKTATSDQEKLVVALRKAIEGDRNFFVAAEADPIFLPARAQVDALLVRLLSGAKEKAEVELISAQAALNKVKDWHAEFASPTDFAAALAAVDRVKQGFDSQTYAEFLDVVPGVRVVKAQATKMVSTQKAAFQGRILDLMNRYRSLIGLKWPSATGEPSDWRRERDAACEDCNQAVKLVGEFGKLDSVSEYEEYVQAESLLKNGVGRLDELKTAAEAAKRKAERQADEAWEEAWEAERKARRQREKRTELIKLHQAVGLLMMCVASAVVGGVLVASDLHDHAAVVGENHPIEYVIGTAIGASIVPFGWMFLLGMYSPFWGSVLFVVLPPVLLVIANSIWNLGNKKPATEPSFGYLWLFLSPPFCRLGKLGLDLRYLSAKSGGY